MEILNIDHLSLTVGNDKKIENGSFTVNSGDVVQLTGTNGSGKSTVIKLIMGDIFGYRKLDFSGTTIIYKGSHDILYDEKEGDLFRKEVCYVSQDDVLECDLVMDCYLNSMEKIDRANVGNKYKYILSFILGFAIQDCFYRNNEKTRLTPRARRLARKLDLDPDHLSESEDKAIRYLSSATKGMSGGQKKLTHIFSNLICYSVCNLFLLDEPLNNLDYGNVRNFSNVLSKIYRTTPQSAIILVTHCRAIPIINRVLKINHNTKMIEESCEIEPCTSCFGETDNEGMYI